MFSPIDRETHEPIYESAKKRNTRVRERLLDDDIASNRQYRARWIEKQLKGIPESLHATERKRLDHQAKKHVPWIKKQLEGVPKPQRAMKREELKELAKRSVKDYLAEPLPRLRKHFPDGEQIPPYIEIKDACRILGVRRSCIEKLEAKGELELTKIFRMDEPVTTGALRRAKKDGPDAVTAESLNALLERRNRED